MRKTPDGCEEPSGVREITSPLSRCVKTERLYHSFDEMTRGCAEVR